MGNKFRYINHDSFDVIDEEGAYWIGFLMTDGCIDDGSRNKRVSLKLANYDMHHIEKFKIFLNSEHKITVHKNENSCSFRFTSEKICNRLSEFGIVPRKTFIAKAYQLESNRDFWRGAIDGDGCIGLINGKPHVTLVSGSKVFLEQFRDFVKSVLHEYNGTVFKHGNNFGIRVNGNQAKYLINYLYSDCAIYLDRKMEKARFIANL